METTNNMEYQIVDSKTKEQIGNIYNTRRAANKKADQLNAEYGAYRYMVIAK